MHCLARRLPVLHRIYVRIEKFVTDEPFCEEIAPPMRTATAHKYVELDANDVSIVTGTTIKVIELVADQLANGWSPEELHFQHPYLSMSQIHSALAYYWDRQSELDADIEQREQYAMQLRQTAGQSPLVQKLRTQGLI